MPPAGASPTRRAPATAIATPGRSASTASARSASGSAAPTARLELTSNGGAKKPDPLALKIAGGAAPLTILVNGVPLGGQAGRTLFWEPDGPGFVRLTVMD